MRCDAVGVNHASRFASGHVNDLEPQIFGTTGGLGVEFSNNISRLQACIGADLQVATWHEIACPRVMTNFEKFVTAILNDAKAQLDFERGAALQKLLDCAAESTGGVAGSWAPERARAFCRFPPGCETG
jgi:hypothetical protein